MDDKNGWTPSMWIFKIEHCFYNLQNTCPFIIPFEVSNDPIVNQKMMAFNLLFRAEVLYRMP